jgi:hypothetical protein
MRANTGASPSQKVALAFYKTLNERGLVTYVKVWCKRVGWAYEVLFGKARTVNG